MAFKPASAKDPNAVKRLPARGKYDEETVFGILDEGYVGHVTFKLPPEEDGDPLNQFPVVIPMIYGRKHSSIYLHGHMSSRLLKTLSEEGVKACVTVTTVQGLVVAINPFHNSNNYRSAVCMGTTTLVEDDAEKSEALALITDHPYRARDGSKGARWANSLSPSEADIKQTRVIRLDIDYASAKVRDGPVSALEAGEEQYKGKYWTGVILREDRYTSLQPSSYNEAPVPDYIQAMVA